MSGDLTTLNGLDVMRIDHGAASRTARAGQLPASAHVANVAGTAGCKIAQAGNRSGRALASPVWALATKMSHLTVRGGSRRSCCRQRSYSDRSNIDSEEFRFRCTNVAHV